MVLKFMRQRDNTFLRLPRTGGKAGIFLVFCLFSLNAAVLRSFGYWPPCMIILELFRLETICGLVHFSMAILIDNTSRLVSVDYMADDGLPFYQPQ